MPGMRVFDAYGYNGCHHLPAVKLHQRPTLAGIQGAIIRTDPENLDLSRGHSKALEVAARWRSPLYLSTRGTPHGRALRAPSPPWVPALAHCHPRLSRPARLLPRSGFGPRPHAPSLVKGGDVLIQGPSVHKGGAACDMRSLPAFPHRRLPLTCVMVQHLPYLTCMRPHYGTLTGDSIHICDALVLDPYVYGANSPGPSTRGMSGTSVLVSCRAPTGRMAIWGQACGACAPLRIRLRQVGGPPVGGCEPTAATE
jgi:hypothetical protein